MQFLGLDEGLEIVKSIELSAKEKNNLNLLPEKIQRVVIICNTALEQLQGELERIS